MTAHRVIVTCAIPTREASLSQVAEACELIVLFHLCLEDATRGGGVINEFKEPGVISGASIAVAHILRTNKVHHDKKLIRSVLVAVTDRGIKEKPMAAR